jgi:hypothetical protein
MGTIVHYSRLRAQCQEQPTRTDQTQANHVHVHICLDVLCYLVTVMVGKLERLPKVPPIVFAAQRRSRRSVRAVATRARVLFDVFDDECACVRSYPLARAHGLRWYAASIRFCVDCYKR